LRVYQECMDAMGWRPVEVRSSTDKNKLYVVHVNPWGDTPENICECKAYLFRGQCRHQSEALKHICVWREGDEPGQTESQFRNNMCPSCGGRTRNQVEWSDD
jgi:hypothetical protein